MKRVPKAQKDALMKQLAQLTQSVQASLQEGRAKVPTKAGAPPPRSPTAAPAAAPAAPPAAPPEATDTTAPSAPDAPDP
jgi:hypothetical protein